MNQHDQPTRDHLAELARLIGQHSLDEESDSNPEFVPEPRRELYPLADFVPCRKEHSFSAPRLHQRQYRSQGETNIEYDDTLPWVQEFFEFVQGVPDINTCEPPRGAKALGLAQTVTRRRSIGPPEHTALMLQCRKRERGPWYWRYRGKRVYALQTIYNQDGSYTHRGTACWERF